MPYQLDFTQSVSSEAVQVIQQQIIKGIEEIDSSQLSVKEKVHQCRKRCKKVRGALRLVRHSFPAVYQRENAWYRDTARPLGSYRDADVNMDVFQRLTELHPDLDQQSLGVIKRKLTLRRKEMVEKQLSPAKLFNQTRERFREGAERIEDWEFSSSDGDWEKGVEKTYVRAQDAMKKAFGSPSVENFHDWRKRVKYHRYHTKLLNELQPSILKGRENALGKLADTLGVEHDLSVLCETLSSEELSVDTGRLKLVLPLINRWQTKLRMESARLGECLFWEKSDWLLNRWKQYEKAYLREEARPDSPPVQFTLSKVKIA